MNSPVLPPVLIACSHGTRSAAGRSVVDGLRDAVRAARPGLDVEAAHVDVHEPFLADVVERVCADAGRDAVVVPLLLSSGYHVRVDIAEALTRGGGRAVASAALGPSEVITDVLVERLGGFAGNVVLAAAGSSDAQAQADVARAAQSLSQRLGRPVTSGFLSAQDPPVAGAVAAARPGPVAVVSYLLAPGVFSARLGSVGAALVTEPLGIDPRVVDLVLARYDETLRR
ncbi:sirohydrochlorin chelatase [Kineococcus rhizosphaerae]|uniref:Sirohydrochlorin ferrochelatase n=1 Tax=Kineococcus rhizosphaerae TaxID=559628 RepID=A0A2T0QZ64_9ACTN|nr:CbiX/SirB N-terminal domain-containing protein [Kineococcus rhizosphaerae]PRY11811.1 sirohydrochlorin ferrochelatase [Kineococcus rhizosphaerae]